MQVKVNEDIAADCSLLTSITLSSFSDTVFAPFLFSILYSSKLGARKSSCFFICLPLTKEPVSAEMENVRDPFDISSVFLVGFYAVRVPDDQTRTVIWQMAISNVLLIVMS